MVIKTKNAFTLIELLLTIVVVGILATMALPRLIRKDSTTKLETVTTELNNLLYYARQEAISKHKNFRLHFIAKKVHEVFVEMETEDPEKPSKSIFIPVKSFYFNPKYTFPKQIEIQAAYLGKTNMLEENKDHAYIHVVPDGLVEEVIIHLFKKDGNEETRSSLKVLPFLGKFELIKGHIKPKKPTL